MQIVGDYVSYTGSVLAIDPSGRGKDETAYAVVKMLNGVLYVIDFGGISGGYSSQTLQALSVIARKYLVNQVLIESNFGDGMFMELLKPTLTKIYPCTIEEVRHSTQKEKRIIDTLEPVMNQHRLVIDQKALEKDYQSVQHYPPELQSKYMMAYQMTRVTKEKGALTHDDRLDVLSMAVNYWVEQMAADVDIKIHERKDDLLDKELEKFMENAVNPTKYISEPKFPTWSNTTF
jgi:hypothetical protein